MIYTIKGFFHQLRSRGIVLLLPGLLFLISCTAPQPKFLVFFATYTGKGSEGIYSCRFNPESGELSEAVLSAVTENPSFLTIDPKGQFLYAVNEIDTFNHEPSGAVSAFVINRGSGKLDLLQQVPSLGAAPAHLSMDNTGQYLLVANYNGGNIAVFPVGKDGRPGKQTAFVQHAGSGPNHERQTGPHAHFIQATGDNRFVMVADLGIDKIMIYQFNASDGTLKPNNPSYVQLDSGAGPRHIAFSPSGNFVYVLNEIASTITVFSYNPATAAMQRKQNISTLPPNFTGSNTTAEVQVDSKGRFLYASNRGHDSIVQFAIDPGNGSLTPVEWIPSGGKTPRNFQIDPAGRWLFAANQDSNNIVLFRIDPVTGKLTQTSQSLKLYSPVCISFLAIK
jgi:6-phosphogluconolactonase